MVLHFIEKLWTGNSRSLKEVSQKVSLEVCWSWSHKARGGSMNLRWSAKLAYEEMWDVQRRLKIFSEPPFHDLMTCVSTMNELTECDRIKKVRSWHTLQKLNLLWQGSLKPFLKAINYGWVAGSVPTIVLWSIITAQALWEASHDHTNKWPTRKWRLAVYPQVQRLAWISK